MELKWSVSSNVKVTDNKPNVDLYHKRLFLQHTFLNLLIIPNPLLTFQHSSCHLNFANSALLFVILIYRVMIHVVRNCLIGIVLLIN